MITLSPEERGKLTLYEYVYRFIRDGIREGRLKPGEKLPSKRALAEHNGISVITVENAYGQLLSEGYILSKPRMGFFVADLQPLPEVRNSRGPAAPQPEKAEKPAVDLTSNLTRPEDFPFSAWSKIVRYVLGEEREKLMINPSWGGLTELREAIAGHLETFRGLTVRPEQILIGAGTEYLYGLLLQLMGRDKIYGVEDPGYSRIARIYGSHGVRCVAVPMDRSGVRVEDLVREKVDVVHISPAHHFPTGLVMPVSRRYELLEWAGEDRYIIEDDYDSEFRMVGRPIPTLQSIDTRDRVIYMNTFSKTLASTVRISYMVLPEPLLERYRETLSFYSCTVSTFEQATLARFIRDGYFEKHLNRMRTDYHRRRDRLLELFREHPDHDRIRISEEDAGLHFLIELDTRLEDGEICRRAAEAGIRLNPLSRYYAGDPGESLHRFIINYSSLDPEIMPRVVEQLYRLLA